jgi:DNA-binding response OmpR family regulator
MSNPLALIIEDDHKLATIFAEALRAANFEPEVAQDGNVALAKLDVTIPGVVVLDLHLPHVSGKDILTQIRADHRLVKTRVILATADPLLAENMRHQADLVLLKPISFSQLRDLALRLRPNNPANNN